MTIKNAETFLSRNAFDKPKNMIGSRFNRLLVVRKSNRVGRNTYWDCICDCGAERTVSTSHLMLRHTQSCGCLQKEITKKRATKHGMYGTSIYKIWAGMISRCYTKSNPIYKYYGGRGVTVCDKWRAFDGFYADVGDRPEGKSLDRWPDMNGNYEPSNVRWATNTEQANNQKHTIFVEYDGEKISMRNLARKLGIDAGRLSQRLYRGWCLEDAIRAG